MSHSIQRAVEGVKHAGQKAAVVVQKAKYCITLNPRSWDLFRNRRMRNRFSLISWVENYDENHSSPVETSCLYPYLGIANGPTSPSSLVADFVCPPNEDCQVTSEGSEPVQCLHAAPDSSSHITTALNHRAMEPAYHGVAGHPTRAEELAAQTITPGQSQDRIVETIASTLPAILRPGHPGLHAAANGETRIEVATNNRINQPRQTLIPSTSPLSSPSPLNPNSNVLRNDHFADPQNLSRQGSGSPFPKFAKPTQPASQPAPFVASVNTATTSNPPSQSPSSTDPNTENPKPVSPSLPRKPVPYRTIAILNPAPLSHRSRPIPHPLPRRLATIPEETEPPSPTTRASPPRPLIHDRTVVETLQAPEPSPLQASPVTTSARDSLVVHDPRLQVRRTLFLQGHYAYTREIVREERFEVDFEGVGEL